MSTLTQYAFGPTTPKALANSSPGLEQPWGTRKKTLLTLKALAITPPICQRFQRWSVLLVSIPKVVASSNLGLKLANAVGVRRSAFGVRCSVFGVRRSAFGVRCSPSAERMGHQCLIELLETDQPVIETTA